MQTTELFEDDVQRGPADATEAPTSSAHPSPAPRGRIQWRTSVPFLAAHVVPVLGVSVLDRRAVLLAILLYVTRLFFITAGYHRYFSHRAYRMGRAMQFVMAFGGTTAAQKGPLWWAAQHRAHHRHADTPRDVHSPQHGFWWSHVGWFLSDRHKAADRELVRDLSVYPELRFLDRHDWIGPWAVALGCLTVAGWPGLVVGFFGSTVALWHATFAVNSVAHCFGRRRYATSDSSRNSALVAVLTHGEGWHNNHHRYPRAARQGHRWWELDLTYLALRGLAGVGLVTDLQPAPTITTTGGERA